MLFSRMRTPPLIRTKEEVKAKLNLLEVRFCFDFFADNSGRHYGGLLS